MIVGLNITKNEDKFKYLKSLIELEKLKDVILIHIKNEADLKSKLKKIDILVTYQIKPNIFNLRSNNLKWIHIGASGIEQNLFPEILKSKVMITNAKGINSKPVSEFIISQIMFFAKNIEECMNFKKNKIWNQWDLAKRTKQLANSTLGIVGYGEIAKELSKRAKALEMTVLATRRLQKKTEKKKYVDMLMPLSRIQYIFKNSDYLAICCPLTPSTKNLINKQTFSLMKKNCILINTSRGEIVNETDLVFALKNKIIKGAAIDVFLKEPLINDSPLYNLQNLFLSPHISGNFLEYQEIMVKQFNEMLIKFMSGKTIKNRVCKKRLY